MSSAAIMNILPIILVFAILYFLLIRPNQRRQRERVNMLSAVQKGDTVITVGGLHGVVQEIDDKTVVLQSGNVQLTFERSSIGSVVK